MQKEEKKHTLVSYRLKGENVFILVPNKGNRVGQEIEKINVKDKTDKTTIIKYFIAEEELINFLTGKSIKEIDVIPDDIFINYIIPNIIENNKLRNEVKNYSDFSKLFVNGSIPNKIIEEIMNNIREADMYFEEFKKEINDKFSNIPISIEDILALSEELKLENYKELIIEQIEEIKDDCPEDEENETNIEKLETLLELLQNNDIETLEEKNIYIDDLKNDVDKINKTFQSDFKKALNDLLDNDIVKEIIDLKEEENDISFN